MLEKDTMIKCGWCGNKNTAEKWNDLSFSECTNREMRRAYTQIYNEKTFSRKANTFYKCPSCGMWSRGSELAIVDTDDEKLLKLGREPIVKLININRNRSRPLP